MSDLMFHFFITALPSSICLTFACISVVQDIHQKTTTTNKVFTALMIASTIYFFAEAFLLHPIEMNEKYLIIDTLCKFGSLSVLPLSAIFIYQRCRKDNARINPMTYCLFIPCIAIGIAAIMIYSIGGSTDMVAFIQAFYDNRGHFPEGFDAPIFHVQHLVCTIIYNAIIMLLLLGVLIYMICNMRKQKAAIFFFLLITTAMIRILLGRTFLINHVYISNILSGLLSLCILHIVIRQLLSGIHYQLKLTRAEGYETGFAEANRSNEETVLQHEAQLYETQDDETPQETVDSQNASALFDNELRDKIQCLVEEQKAYLDPELTIDMVASQLHTNRTYISTTINSAFGVNFKEYLNTHRLNHAKRLMKEQPNATLDDIASHSGFGSAAQLIRKFKEVEGVTPRKFRV